MVNFDSNALAKLCEEQGVRRLRVFGSAARGEERPDSDVDLIVEFDPNASIGLFLCSQLRRELSQILNCNVDLTTPDALHQALKADILKEAIHAA